MPRPTLFPSRCSTAAAWLWAHLSGLRGVAGWLSAEAAAGCVLLLIVLVMGGGGCSG